MPHLRAPRARRLAALILSAFISTPLLACPAGQVEVCLAQCLCVSDPDGSLDALQKQVRQVAAPALAGWLQRARDQAVAEGVEPIPLNLRVQLRDYYPDEVLDAARYRVGDSQQLDAANAMLQNEDVAAVTLVDVIVFRNAKAAQNDLALWAHELQHVQQYRKLGVDGFAERYVRNYNELEGPAYAIQNQVEQAQRRVTQQTHN